MNSTPQNNSEQLNSSRHLCGEPPSLFNPGGQSSSRCIASPGARVRVCVRRALLGYSDDWGASSRVRVCARLRCAASLLPLDAEGGTVLACARVHTARVSKGRKQGCRVSWRFPAFRVIPGEGMKRNSPEVS